MPEQFENSRSDKSFEDETVSDSTAQKHMSVFRKGGGEGSSHTEQSYDEDHQIISK